MEFRLRGGLHWNHRQILPKICCYHYLTMCILSKNSSIFLNNAIAECYSSMLNFGSINPNSTVSTLTLPRRFESNSIPPVSNLASFGWRNVLKMTRWTRVVSVLISVSDVGSGRSQFAEYFAPIQATTISNSNPHENSTQKLSALGWGLGWESRSSHPGLQSPP